MSIDRYFTLRRNERGASSAILLIIIAVILAMASSWLLRWATNILYIFIQFGVTLLIFLVILYGIRAMIKKMD